MRLGPDLRRRSTEPELLDDAHCHPDDVAKSLSDLRFVNRWLSARGRLLRAVAPYMPPGGRLLDVGCGSGDVAAFLQSRLSPPRWKRGGPVRAVAVDLKPLHLRHAPRGLARVAADLQTIGTALPGGPITISETKANGQFLQLTFGVRF